MKITIVNQHTNNFGDEAAGIALIQTLRKNFKNLEINIIYNGDGTINIKDKKVNHLVDCKLKHMGYINIFIKLLFHSYKGNSFMKKFDNVIKDSDYVLVAPCGANIGIYKDWRFLIRLLFVIFNKKTPIFYLNTIGASGNFMFDKIASFVLKKSKIYVRETASKEYIESLGYKCELGVDTAFLLETNTNYCADKNTIIFVPSDISKHKNFVNIDCEKIISDEIISELCSFAKEENKHIHILPHLNTSEEHEFIYKIIKIMKEKYNFKHVYFDEINDMYAYYEKIANSYMVVGMRYHSIVLAAKARIPFVSLAYENKMLEVSRYTSMEEQCILLYKNHKKSSIYDAMIYAKENHKSIKQKLDEVNGKLTELAMLPLKEIKNDK